MALCVFRDAAVILQDVTDVLVQYEDVPPGLANTGRELVIAVLHRDPIELGQALQDLQAEIADVSADTLSAQPAWDKLVTDLKKLIADVS